MMYLLLYTSYKVFMKDSVLIKKICEEVKNLCSIYHYTKVMKLELSVNFNSNVNNYNLYKNLRSTNKKIFGPWTEIVIKKDNIQEQSAILHSIDGI
jgi:hypothetical protein